MSRFEVPEVAREKKKGNITITQRTMEVPNAQPSILPSPLP